MTEPDDHPAIYLLRDWFNRGQSGCKFASHLASQDPRLAFWVHLEGVADLDLTDVNTHIDEAAIRGDVSLVVFPRISTEAEIAELAEHLEHDERWSVNSLECPSNLESLGLGIEFTTGSGDQSRAMGFAPSGFMPVTRRAPFVALALWAGARANNFFRYSPEGTVNMADIDTGLERGSHKSMWERSVGDTQRRLLDPPHDSVWLRRVAYCLPRSLVTPRWPLG